MVKKKFCIKFTRAHLEKAAIVPGSQETLGARVNKHLLRS